MQLPCVIMRNDMFFAGIFTFLVCLRFKFKFWIPNVTCPIYNATLKILKIRKMWRNIVVFLSRKVFISVSLSLLLANKKCGSHFRRETAEKKRKKIKSIESQFILNQTKLSTVPLLIGHCYFCAHYAYSPFKFLRNFNNHETAWCWEMAYNKDEY